jgi:hypothetical protein
VVLIGSTRAPLGAQPRLDGEKKIAVLAKTLQAMSSPQVSEQFFSG